MSTNFFDLTCSAAEPRGYKVRKTGLSQTHVRGHNLADSKKRPASKSMNERPRKREPRATSTASSITSIGPSHQNNRVPERSRYVGDGIDGRRPATSTGSLGNPIDLSDSEDGYETIDDDIAVLMPPSRPGSTHQHRERTDQRSAGRGPRFSRSIINLDDASTSTGRGQQLALHEAAVSGGDAVDFGDRLPPIANLTRTLPPLSERERQQPILLSQREDALRPPGFRPPPDAEVYVIDDENEDREEGGLFVEDSRGNRLHDPLDMRPQVNRNIASGRTLFNSIPGLRTLADTFPAFSRQLTGPTIDANSRLSQTRNLMRNLEQVRRSPAQHPQHHHHHYHHHHHPPVRPTGIGNFIRPTLDYAMQAFDFGPNPHATSPPAVPQPSTSPAYDELPPCADGYTRSPREEDFLICPRCKKELCVEDNDDASCEDGDVANARKEAASKGDRGREEVWVVKACGHVRTFSLPMCHAVRHDERRYTDYDRYIAAPAHVADQHECQSRKARRLLKESRRTLH